MLGTEGEILTLEGVTREFPGFRLERVSFSLEPGYVMGLIGPNGAGKTTTVKLILNLIRPQAGRIRVFGLDSVTQEGDIKRHLGYLGEKAPLPESATAEWLGSFMARYFPTWDRSLYRHYLKRFEVPEGKPARALSKGTRTKLALAAAMGHRPQLLILDEPTSGLDPLVRHEVVDALRDVVSDEGHSVLFSTHIVSDLEAIADFVAVLVKGRLITCETREQLADRWRRLTFRPRDPSSTALAPLLQQFVETRQLGSLVTGVTGAYGPTLRGEVEAAAAGPVETCSLALEEIFRYLVSSHSPAKGHSLANGDRPANSLGPVGSHSPEVESR